jgi:hypothetical protein
MTQTYRPVARDPRVVSQLWAVTGGKRWAPSRTIAALTVGTSLAMTSPKGTIHDW